MAQASASSSPRSGSVLPKFEVRTAQASGSDADVVGVFQDKGQKSMAPKGKYAKSVERLRKTDSFAGRSDQTLFLRLSGKGAENGLLVGLGQASELTAEKLRAAGGAVWARLCAEKSRSVAVH